MLQILINTLQANYVVNNTQDFINLSNQKDLNIIFLNADLDFQNQTIEPVNIGNAEFQGLGHIIKNVVIQTQQDRVALFKQCNGKLQNFQIDNIEVKSVSNQSITSKQIIAGVCAVLSNDIESINIKNAQLTMEYDIEAVAVGIIAGVINGDSQIKNCQIQAQVNVDYDNNTSNYAYGVLLGGVAAQVNSNANVNVTSCYVILSSSLNIYNKIGYVGGLLGQLYQGNKIILEKNMIQLSNVRAPTSYAVYEGGLVGDANQIKFDAKLNQVNQTQDNIFGAAIGYNSSSQQVIQSLIISDVQGKHVTTVSCNKKVSECINCGYQDQISGDEFVYVNKIYQELQDEGFTIEDQHFKPNYQSSPSSYSGSDLVQDLQDPDNNFVLCSEAQLGNDCNVNAICQQYIQSLDVLQIGCKCKQGYLTDDQGVCQPSECFKYDGICYGNAYLCDYSKVPSTCVKKLEDLGSNKFSLETQDLITIIIGAVALVFLILFIIFLSLYIRTKKQGGVSKEKKVKEPKKLNPIDDDKMGLNFQRQVINDQALLISKQPANVQLIKQDGMEAVLSTTKSSIPIKPEDLAIKPDSKIKKAADKAKKGGNNKSKLQQQSKLSLNKPKNNTNTNKSSQGKKSELKSSTASKKQGKKQNSK